MGILGNLTGVVGILVAVAGIAVAAMHLGRVRGAGLLLAGFSLQAFAGILFRLTTLVLPRLGSASYTPIFAVGSLVALAGAITVVAGVHSVLTSVRAGGAAPAA